MAVNTGQDIFCVAVKSTHFQLTFLRRARSEIRAPYNGPVDEASRRFFLATFNWLSSSDRTRNVVQKTPSSSSGLFRSFLAVPSNGDRPMSELHSFCETFAVRFSVEMRSRKYAAVTESGGRALFVSATVANRSSSIQPSSCRVKNKKKTDNVAQQY